MSKQRMVNTKFWNDSYISELDPIEKLLFLYFLTNEHTNIAGVYEIPLKIIAIETGIDKEMLPKIIRRFEGKIYYINGWLYIKNFERHQFARGNSKVIKGIENALLDVPIGIKQKIAKLSQKGIPHTSPSVYSDSDSDLDSDSDTDADKKKAAVINFENIQQNPLWETIKTKYPFRDYEFEFNKMLDWWKSKNKTPKSITAFTNWLSISKADPNLVQEAQKEMFRQEQLKVREEFENRKPANPEKLNEIRENINKLKAKF